LVSLSSREVGEYYPIHFLAVTKDPGMSRREVLISEIRRDRTTVDGFRKTKNDKTTFLFPLLGVDSVGFTFEEALFELSILH